MPNLLIVSATAFEIEPTLKFLSGCERISTNIFKSGKGQVEVCITGVGMVQTAFELGKIHDKKFDLAINAGVAGCFSDRRIGEVVNVAEDCLSELGAENDEVFLTIDELGFGQQHVQIQNKATSATISGIPLVSGITVNRVHGNESSIKEIRSRTSAEVESMEGAAFILAANHSKWHAVQLRAISNKVEKRNKDNWNLPLAINQLNEVIIKIIKENL